MKDTKTANLIAALHPKAIPHFQGFIDDVEQGLGIIIRVTYGLRSFEEQRAIYNQGRITPGPKVSNAPPGFSFHNYGLAIDVCELKGGKLNWNFDFAKLKPYGDKHLLRWGGTFKSIVDKPHFEISFGYTIRQLYQKYVDKDFIAGTKYLNL